MISRRVSETKGHCAHLIKSIFRDEGSELGILFRGKGDSMEGRIEVEDRYCRIRDIEVENKAKILSIRVAGHN